VTEPPHWKSWLRLCRDPVLERGHERGRTGLIRSTECEFVHCRHRPANHISVVSCDEISNGLAASWLWSAWSTVIQVYRRPRLDRPLPTRLHSSMCPMSNHCVWPNKTNSARELDNGQSSAGSRTGNQLSISSGRWKRISRGKTRGSTDGRSPPPHPAVRESWCGCQRAARSVWKWDYVDQPTIQRPVWQRAC